MVKLVCWDIDGVFWKGVYLYDGENVSLMPSTVKAVKLLDDGGILQSIISRNPPDVLNLVEKLGLRDFFILPKVTWGSKTASMVELLEQTHLLPKDVIFVDDDVRERESMKYTFPDIKCISPVEVPGMLTLIPKGKASQSSNMRKKFFKSEEERLKILKQVKSSRGFLKILDLRLKIKKPTSLSEWDRVVELINRTNQMNATGNKFANVEQFKGAYPTSTVFVGYPEDRFGAYGLALIAVCEKPSQKSSVFVNELVVSCRVLERGLLAPFLQYVQLIMNGQSLEEMNQPNYPLELRYRPTKYNDVLRNQINQISDVVSVDIIDSVGSEKIVADFVTSDDTVRVEVE